MVRSGILVGPTLIGRRNLNGKGKCWGRDIWLLQINVYLREGLMVSPRVTYAEIFVFPWELPWEFRDPHDAQFWGPWIDCNLTMAAKRQRESIFYFLGVLSKFILQ
jgi:hypothetical protein